jgi:hypothetical protein
MAKEGLKMKKYKLYVDESGTSYPGSHKQSPYYILLGCIIDSIHQGDLKIYADQIKFKYWGRTDIVFHSAEIARNSGDFSIFRGKPDLKTEFLKDLFTFLQAAKVTLTLCLVDKELAHSRRWSEKTVVQRTARSVMGSFLAKITANTPSNGKMVFEVSNGFKDEEYLAAFNYYLSPNFLRVDPDFRDVRGCLTSINFVTKQNHDIETQLSDLLAYAAKCKYLSDKSTQTYAVGSYEDKLIKVLETKLIRTPSSIGREKKKFYNKINSFDILPS